MSFFRKLFGLPTDDEILADDVDVDYTSPAAEQTPASASPASAPSEPVVPPSIDPAMKARIFAGVVAVFNESLPDFLRRSVDPERQQQRLVEAMDASCNEYLNSLLQQASAYAEGRLKSAADEARQESERLKEEMENVNRARNTMREQQLSADRRNRALNERVRDLEEQVSKLEAEREQFQLENKSLMNKLKVADVQPSVVDDLTREVEELRSRLASGNINPTPASTVELNSLKTKVDALNAALTQVANEKTALEEAKSALEEAKASLETQLKELGENFENATKRAEMQEAMYSDLQSTLADTKSELEAAKAEAAETAKKTAAKLEEARELVKNFSLLEKQFANVAKVIKKRDETIERLRAEKRELKDALKAKVSSSTGNLFAINDEVEPATDEAAPVENAPLPDDDFQVPDWFVSEPAPVPKDADTNFGYQEPPRKPRHPDNDAQMSLF